MYRKWLGIAAVALVGLMLIPEPAAAQGRGWYRGWYGGPGWTYSGYYGPYWGSSYYGGYYSRPYYSNYYYGGYYSRPFYSNYYGPSYYSYDYTPRYSTYDYYMPRYNYSYGAVDSGYYSNSSMTTADYDSGAAPGGSTALVDVKVPPDATIWFDETQMTQRGSLRQFITPPLDSSRNFSYEVHAQWKEGDRTINQTREVTVHAGDQLLVDFTTRPADGQPKAPPRAREGANMHEGTFLSFGGTELVMTDRRGKRHSHTLAADAIVTIDGRPASAEDLKPDMHIKVTTQKGDPNTATRIEATSNGSPRASGEPRETRLESHEGTFVSLNNNENELVMDRKGKRHSHMLAADAQITIDGRPARAEDLKPDMHIKVTTQKGDPKTATRIEARSKK